MDPNNNTASPNGLSKEQGSFKFSDSPSLELIRQMEAAFCQERKWEKFHSPRNLLLALVGEVGEVSELFQWRGEEGAPVGLANWSEEDRIHLGEELSDVLIYLVRLADQCHIDLPAAVVRKLKINAAKYPADKVAGSSKKYTEYQREECNGTVGNGSGDQMKNE